jgi:hypothetical protein
VGPLNRYIYIELTLFTKVNETISKKEIFTMQRKLSTTLLIALLFLATITSTHAQSFLEEEAGITAYISAGKSINLARVVPVYRTIENQTDDFIVGSVAVADYGEAEDAHVYVHTDGWIAAYYLADEPVAKIIDWRRYDGGGMPATKLELALQRVADAVSVAIPEVKYYDFTAPQANRLLIVAERENGHANDPFDILIPDDITVFKRSIGLYTRDSSGSSFTIDADVVASFGELQNGENWIHNKLTPSQLSEGIFHTITLANRRGHYSFEGWSSGALVLVYQQP